MGKLKIFFFLIKKMFKHLSLAQEQVHLSKS